MRALAAITWSAYLVAGACAGDPENGAALTGVEEDVTMPVPAYPGLRLPLPDDRAVLDRVPNPHPDTNYVARFTAPEFTTLCPVTGQPDFAHLVIDYAPEAVILESKSLKLYLASFRNHGAFHEDCTLAIGGRLFREYRKRGGELPEQLLKELNGWKGKVENERHRNR